MKTVAIVSEYNPFHNGHLYQIEKIREEFGADTRIIAIMSGNYTQRGEIAILDKWERAKIAVKCGVDLVLELPFPYSCASAEFFARAAVHIANSLGVVDILSFGSEAGDIEILKETAQNTLNPTFLKEVSALTQKAELQSNGYPAILEVAYYNVYGVKCSFDSPNNILAIEYIKALIQLESSIMPHTIKRLDSEYNEESIIDSEIQSATAIRKALSEDIYSAQDYIPKPAFDIISLNSLDKKFPCDAERISSAIISNLIFNVADSADIHDAGGGLYNRLIKQAYEATSISNLIDLTKTKKYTTARIRRVIWYSFFGVTSSDLRELPSYTQVLAMDKNGQALLKKIKKTSSFSVLTKPSRLPEEQTARGQKALCDKADILFQHTKHSPEPASSIYKRTPFILL
ncbi:MAG: nucleotidyltransferase family protein [Clostridia bacterium]|nr:nucleotidyltransferase family protein [Clostridia bacterium]